MATTTEPDATASTPLRRLTITRLNAVKRWYHRQQPECQMRRLYNRLGGISATGETT